MDDKTLNDAVENISIIKEVIERTSKSFAAFSKIFIQWGILFIFNSVITILLLNNTEKMSDIYTKYPWFGYIFPAGVFIILATLIYHNIVKKVPLVGLEKHLMILWILTLIMNVIPQKIYVNAAVGVDLQSVSVEYNNFPVVLFSLAIALIVTSLLTGYKQPKYVGCVYIGVSFLLAFLRLPTNGISAIQVLYGLALPFTFLYLGFFLRNQQARGN
jgi:hypothetical protein